MTCLDRFGPNRDVLGFKIIESIYLYNVCNFIISKTMKLPRNGHIFQKIDDFKWSTLIQAVENENDL